MSTILKLIIFHFFLEELEIKYQIVQSFTVILVQINYELTSAKAEIK